MKLDTSWGIFSMVHSECLEMTLSLSLTLTLSPLFIRCIQLAMTIEATLRGQTIPDLTPTTAIPLVTIETRQLLQQLLILTPTRTPEAMTWRLTVCTEQPRLAWVLRATVRPPQITALLAATPPRQWGAVLPTTRRNAVVLLVVRRGTIPTGGIKVWP
jgi:hypothetical protein